MYQKSNEVNKSVECVDEKKYFDYGTKLY